MPVVRYVDPDLTGRMTEYVALHVLWHQRRMSEFLQQQARQEWKYLPEPAAHEVRVGIMGLGIMGEAAATAAGRARLQLNGWSRGPKQLAGVGLLLPAATSSARSWRRPTSSSACCRTRPIRAAS